MVSERREVASLNRWSTRPMRWWNPNPKTAPWSWSSYLGLSSEGLWDRSSPAPYRKNRSWVFDDTS